MDLEARVAALEVRVGTLEAQLLPAVRAVAEELSQMRATLERHMAHDQTTMTAWGRDLANILAWMKAHG